MFDQFEGSETQSKIGVNCQVVIFKRNLLSRINACSANHSIIDNNQDGR